VKEENPFLLALRLWGSSWVSGKALNWLGGKKVWGENLSPKEKGFDWVFHWAKKKWGGDAGGGKKTRGGDFVRTEEEGRFMKRRYLGRTNNN